MIQSEGDPATAYEGALAAHQSTADHTRLVSVNDEGQHGVYLAGPSPCAERIGDAFLFNGVLPAEDKVCGTTPLPRDKKVYALKGPLDGKSYSIAPHAVVGPSRFAERGRPPGPGRGGSAVARLRPSRGTRISLPIPVEKEAR